MKDQQQQASSSSSSSKSMIIKKPDIVVGQTRIQDCDGFIGTIVYVGPVASAKNQSEQYAGIKWDDVTRGKHDGSVICRSTKSIVRHFGDCGPTQGSFLKLSKVDFGCNLTSALLREKYVEIQAPLIAPNNLLEHTAMTSRGNPKPIEFLGEMKIRKKQQLEDIDKISLRRLGISKVDEHLDSNETEFENIRHLDLAGNLFCSWSEVVRVINQVPNLEDFSIAYNRICDINGDNDDIDSTLQFPNMKILNLNTCSVKSFNTIQWISKVMPNLEQLCIASSNCFVDIDSLDKTNNIKGLFQNLLTLDCSNCNLTSWEHQVTPLFAELPNLQHLCLDDNMISSIPTPPPKLTTSSSSTPLYFPKLQSLQIARTQIEKWMDIEGLNSLCCLNSLKLKSTPLTSRMSQSEVRFLAIARIPNLKYFNSSQIQQKEIVEAEKRYLTFVTKLVLSSDNSNEEEEQKLLSGHPQYLKLQEKYKTLVDTITQQHNHNHQGGGRQGQNGTNSNGGSNSNNIMSTVINVTIRSMAPASCGMEPLVKRLPGTLTVGRLKALCGRSFGFDQIDLMSLHFRNDTKTDAFPTELDNDDNNLNYYGVCDGAEILMNEIDLESKRIEDRRLKEQQEEKIRQEERNIKIKMEEMKKMKQ